MQTTHRVDEDGRYIQVVTPQELRAALDREGDDYERPEDFESGDEWDVGDL